MDLQIAFISLSIGAIFSTLILYQLNFENFFYLNMSELFYKMNKPLIFIWGISIIFNVGLLVVKTSFIPLQYSINSYDIYILSSRDWMLFITSGISFLILLIYVYSLVNFIRKFDEIILKEKKMPLVLEQIAQIENINVAETYFFQLFKNNNQSNLKLAQNNLKNDTYILCIFDEINSTSHFVDMLEVYTDDSNIGEENKHDYFQNCIRELKMYEFEINSKNVVRLIKINYKLNKRNYEMALELEKDIIGLCVIESVFDIKNLVVMYIESRLDKVSHYFEELLNKNISLYPELPLMLISEYNKLRNIEVNSSELIILDIEGNIVVSLSENIDIILWAHEINEEYNSIEDIKILIQEKINLYNKRIKDVSDEYTSVKKALNDSFIYKEDQFERSKMLINDIFDYRLKEYFEEYISNQELIDAFRNSRENFYEYCQKKSVNVEVLDCTDFDIDSIVNNLIEKNIKANKVCYSLLQILNSKIEFNEIKNIEKKQYRKLIQEFIKYTNPDIFFSQISILEKLTNKVLKYNSDYMWDCFITGTSGLPKNYFYSKSDDNWDLAYDLMQLRRIALMLKSLSLTSKAKFAYEHKGKSITMLNLFHFTNILKNINVDRLLAINYIEIRTYYNSLEIDIFNNKLSIKVNAFDRQSKNICSHSALVDWNTEVTIIQNLKNGNFEELERLEVENSKTRENLDFLISKEYLSFIEEFK